MTSKIDKTYRIEKLLDSEREIMKDENSIFSLSKKLTWVGIGFVILGLSFFGLIAPFLPPRAGYRNWEPPTTVEEYKFRVTDILITTPIIIIAVIACLNVRNKIDLILGIKRIADFRITKVIDLEVSKILIMNGWRIFSIKVNQPYFTSASQGQIITIKRTGTFKIFEYFIRNS